MKNIESQCRIIKHQSKELYDFIADFHHFEKFLPKQVTNWNVTDTNCSFNISNLGKFALQMEKDDVTQWVKYIGISGPAPFELLWKIKPNTVTSCLLSLTAFADVSSFMLMVISKPTKNFVTTLLDKIEELG